MFIKKEIRLLILAVTILFLFGCAGVSIPTKLGITESEWSSYGPDKQQVLLASYKKFAQEHDKSIKEKPNNAVNSTFLEVSIHDGKVMMPPFSDWQNYNPVKFIIFKDQCSDIALQQPTDKNTYVDLGVCFKGNILYLDPSHYDLMKKNGSISINFSPLWVSGFSYKGISSSGYVRLNNVTVEIVQKEEIPTVIKESH